LALLDNKQAAVAQSLESQDRRTISFFEMRLNVGGRLKMQNVKMTDHQNLAA